MNKFYLDEEYKRIADKYNLTEKQVKEIYESQFTFAREAFKIGIKNEPDSFKNLNFIKLGKLYAKKGIIEKYKKIAENKLKKEEEQNNEQTNS